MHDWAWFVSGGYFPSRNQGPVHPVAVEWEAGQDDVLAEVVSRLKELGDEVDGHPSAAEMRSWLA